MALDKTTTGEPSSTIQKSSHNSTFQVLPSLETIVDRYDGFILDQFGVMHNGVHALEGAADCVASLAAQSKNLVILSNSSSLSTSTVGKLPKLGFDPNHFRAAVTSGEEASHYIRSKHAGQKAIFLTWKTPKTPSPMNFLEQCGDVTIVDTVQEADFILLHGCEVWRGPGPDGQARETDLGCFPDTGNFSVLDPLLQEAATKKLPMVCANPDFVMVRPDGSQGHMPGKIAARYEQVMGGKVIPFGKPHREHFEACIQKLGLPKEKVVHVGDSLHHDIAGANETGIDSIFVSGGVHCPELECVHGSLPSQENLEKLFATHGETPTYVVPLFRM